MFKVCIIDDELNIRRGLSQVFDWEAFDLQLVGTASSGKEAIDLIEAEHPEIIICDIRMEDMTGLDLMRTIISQYEKIKFIFISGYDDFAYCQRALEYGAIDYILKPVDFIKLKRSLHTCISVINKERSYETINAILDQNQLLLKETFLNTLIRRELSDAELEGKIQWFNVNRSAPFFVVAVIQSETDYPEDPACIFDSTEFKDVILKGYLQNFISVDSLDTHVFLDNYGHTVILFYPGRGISISVDEVFEEVRALHRKIYEKTGFTFTVGFGNPVGDLGKIRSSYLDASVALTKRALVGKNSVIRFTDTEQNFSDRSIDIENKIDKLEEITERVDLDELSDYIKQIFNHLSILKDPLARAKHFAVNAVVLFNNLLVKYQSEIDRVLNLSFNQVKEIDYLDTLPELCEWLVSRACSVVETMKSIRQNHKSVLIQRIIEYINSKYSEQISIADISDKFYINKSYFSELFKEITGTNFKKYIIDFRLEKAKILLVRQNMTISMIAEAVGFNDPQYFSKVFKKHEGCTPTQYQLRFDNYVS